MFSKHLKKFSVAFAVIVAALSLTVGLANGRTGPVRHAHRAVARTATVVDPASVFGVLGAPRSASDDVDASMHPADLPGAASAHRLPAPPNSAMWLSSDGKLACLTIKAFNGGGQICETLSWAASHGIAMTVTDPADGSHVIAGGAVPDGASGVSVDTNAKAGLRPGLTNHAFAVESNSPTESWHFTLPSGDPITQPLASSAG